MKVTNIQPHNNYNNPKNFKGLVATEEAEKFISEIGATDVYRDAKAIFKTFPDTLSLVLADYSNTGKKMPAVVMDCENTVLCWPRPSSMLEGEIVKDSDIFRKLMTEVMEFFT